jgi:hypothetical protein
MIALTFKLLRHAAASLYIIAAAILAAKAKIQGDLSMDLPA